MHPITLNAPNAPLAGSELVLNPDGSVYHLAMRPEHVGDLVIIAGDPGRVERISSRFERIEHRTHNREFVAHTGVLNGVHITALGTGIGPDNIDIVLNELDALVNIDLATRLPKDKPRSLRIVRLGTCGSLQADIPVGARIVSAFGVGLDNLAHYYAHENTDRELRLLQDLMVQADWPENLPYPYVAQGDHDLVERLGRDNTVGITYTAGGFYGPQGRSLRLVPAVDDLNERLAAVTHEGLRATNFEMETSALYALGGMLGHRVCTVCCVVANRFHKQADTDHHAAIEHMIDEVLQRLT